MTTPTTQPPIPTAPVPSEDAAMIQRLRTAKFCKCGRIKKYGEVARGACTRLSGQDAQIERLCRQITRLAEQKIEAERRLRIVSARYRIVVAVLVVWVARLLVAWWVGR